MSALQKTIMKNKLPPRCPKTSALSKMAPFGAGRRKDYTPVAWKEYFHRTVDVEIDGGSFRVYLSPEPDHQDRPRIVTLHGGGYSGLSWALFTEEITNMIHCQVVSIDIRGHGETKADNPDDLSIETLVHDVEQVLHKLFTDGIPPLILVGHSMGGAVAVRVALQPSLEHAIHGIAVIDVVEGTAMDALASMQSFLRSRPTHFKSIEHAIEWCVRSGQVRNVGSAKVSMPSQIVNCETGLLATNEVETYTCVSDEPVPTPTRHEPLADRIAEEDDEDEEGEVDAEAAPELCLKPTVLGDGTASMNCETGLLATNEVETYTCVSDEPVPTPTRHEPLADRIAEEDDEDEEGEVDAEAAPELCLKPTVLGDGTASMKYKWRIDLSKTERHWAGWFGGLSAAFLRVRAPRLLLLAHIDGLDRDLTVGQMQGKFQMQVLTRCGHAVHEDTPGEVARVVASFALRHRLTAATENGEQMQLVHGSMPGC